MIAAILGFWFMLGSFVTPWPRPESYRAIRISGQAPTPASVALYRWRGAAGVMVPMVDAKLPGERDSAWVSMTELPPAGGFAYRAFPVNADTLGDPSNVVLATVSDTLIADITGHLWLEADRGIRWPEPNPFRPLIRVAAFHRWPDDDAVFAPDSPCLVGLGPLVKYGVLLNSGRVRCCVDSTGAMLLECVK